MAASIQVTDTIESNGFPLAFKVHEGNRPAVLNPKNGNDVFRVEARALSGHQKEAVVTQGTTGAAWRVVSDEGPALHGTDLAPFPLGFMSAGLQADVLGRIEKIAASQGVALKRVALELSNSYAFEGSFFKGDGKGSARPPQIEVRLESDAPSSAIRALVADALDASPLVAAWRAPLANTFALFANGRRQPLSHMNQSSLADAGDPLKTWKDIPRPFAGTDPLPDLIAKVGPVVLPGGAPAALPAQAVRTEIPIRGSSQIEGGMTRSETWAERLGGTRFALVSDERADRDQAPIGIALASAGVTFCLMTQFLRYVEYHKMDIRALRVVQETPYTVQNGKAIAQPFDTHVYLHGNESVDTMERLMQMATNTCYLHASLHDALEPVVTITFAREDRA